MEELANVLLTLDPKLVDEHVDAFLLDEDKLTLSQLLPRIIHERGSFKNITEQSLLNEIKTTTNSPDTPLDTPEEVEYINEQFHKDKNELLKYIGTALNDCSLSLDFVSLLISCVRPAAGTISMSAHLKKFIPPGSLNSDIVLNTQSQWDRQRKIEEQKVLGQGWKLSALEMASKSLHDSSARLLEQIHKEKMFWDTIAKNFNNKEIIVKDRIKSTRVFLLKYGYEDSGSTYKAQGNAVLKPQGNSIQFIPMNNNSMNKVIKVRIIKEDDIIGESKILMDFNDSLKSQIEKARYCIFEEELFQTLMDESIGMNDLEVDESKIVIPGHECIEITFMEYDETEHLTREEDTRAELIATYLRLMLSLKHKKNLEYKKEPKVLKSTQRQRSSQLVLKPLIGQLKHEDVVNQLYQALKSIIPKETTLKINKYSNIKDGFNKLVTPPISTLYLYVNDLKIRVQIDSYDFLSFVIKVMVIHKGKRVLKNQFEELGQLEECLNWVIESYKGV